jgi:ubiquitin thioesterase OTU1
MIFAVWYFQQPTFHPISRIVRDLLCLLFPLFLIERNGKTDVVVKYSYPPKPLLGSPTDKLSSIPIMKGEQFIVSISSSPSATGSKISTPVPTPVAAPSIKHLNERLSAPSRLTPAPASQASTPVAAPPPSIGSGASIRPENGGGKDESARIELPGDAGSLELRKVPDDNSCLFSAIAVVFEGGIEGAGGLRKVVVDAIRKDPETYSEVMLGYVSHHPSSIVIFVDY